MNKIVLLAIITLGWSSCYYDNREELYPVVPGQCETTNLTYTNNIKIIIDKSCAVTGCHVTGAELPVLETYADVVANMDRIQVRALVEKSMPPAGPLSTCEQNQLHAWLADGNPE